MSHVRGALGRSPLRSPLRFSAAAACLVAAAAHVPVVEDHLQEAAYVGVLFIALSVACCLAAVLLARWDTRRVWLAVAGIGASAIGAFVWSRAVGLPQITDDVGAWTTPLAEVAVAAESVMVLFGVLALRRRSGSARWRLSRGWRPVLAGAAVLGAGLAWTGVAAASGPGEGMGHAGAAMSGAGYWASVGGGGFTAAA